MKKIEISSIHTKDKKDYEISSIKNDTSSIHLNATSNSNLN